YFAVIDFAGFEKAIDQVGGVDVQIDRTFTDYSYPDSSLGYLAPVTFTEGSENMNSTRALQFARSRHAAGPEGSDFSRSTRQQKIISAFKAKVLSLNLISNAGTINSLLSTFANHFHTNITPGGIFHLFNLIKETNVNSFISLSLDPSTSLVCPKIMEDTGAYVLVPCEGKSETDIKNFFKNVFSLGKMVEEKSVIWLSTSSGDRTTYQKADQKLKEVGLTVWELSYKGEPLSKNIFYQVNPKNATAEFIKNSLSATEVTLPPPDVNINKDKVDIIVILGENSN
ncbi:MAG: LCP family protein, partial [Patescibacteria group bacterium]